MIIGPEEVELNIAKEEANIDNAYASRLETAIDVKLRAIQKRGSSPDAFEVILSGDDYRLAPSERVQNELNQRFINAGWGGISLAWKRDSCYCEDETRYVITVTVKK